MKTKKSKIFEIIAIILIALYAISIAPKTLQNDTFYTIKIGEVIVQSEKIDMVDHFSWYKGLDYTYPHWLYDVMIYSIYNIGGMDGIYISTCIFAAILGIVFYEVNKKINKNQLLSFFITILAIYMLQNYIAARAQLVTFTLFVLEIYSIEMLLKTGKKRYGIYLILISTLIANLHVAVWPFTFVLYLPYIVEYIISLFYKKTEDSKIIIIKNDNTKLLIIFMVCCAFTGFLTPLGTVPYTYLVKTMQGISTNWISEHAPMILINRIGSLCVITVLLMILIFTKAKIKLSDLFMLSGLILLMLYTARQESIFIIIGFICINRILNDFIRMYNEKLDEILTNAVVRIWVMSIIIICFLIVDIQQFSEKKDDEYIDETEYPVEMCEYILSNYSEEEVNCMRIFNDYNFGSYLIYKNIPVFIDSRADLYLPEFNKDVFIFEDFMETSFLERDDIEDTFEKYNVTHILLKNDDTINKMLEKMVGEKYKLIKKDEYFSFYEISK